jgi:hypothetical protein
MTRPFLLAYTALSLAAPLIAGAVAGMTPVETLAALARRVIGLAFAMRGMVGVP